MSAPIATETNLGSMELLRGAMWAFYAALAEEGISFPPDALTPGRMIKFLIAARLYSRAFEVVGWCAHAEATTTDEAVELLESLFHKYLDFASSISESHAAGWRQAIEQSAWRGGHVRVIEGGRP